MPTSASVFQNYSRWEIEGSADLSAAGAVTATRGDGVSCVKNGVGLYDFTISGGQGMKMVALLSGGAFLLDAAIGTVKDVGVKSVTQATDGTDTVTVTVRTVDAAGADVDEATNALTISFRVVIQTRNQNAYP